MNDDRDLGAQQLTPAAVATGMLLGGVLALSNLYVVLKTGWSLGVTLTSCILAFGAFRVLRWIGLVKRDLSVLENVMTGSVASAAGFMTGGGNMAALPALLLTTGQRPSGWAMLAWFAVIAALGVLTAIPIKRQIIDEEKLPFPSAVATAAALRSMHAGRGDGARTRPLFFAAAISAVFTWLREAGPRLLHFGVPARLTLPVSIGGHPAAAFSFAFDSSFVLVGGGALMGVRTAWSMLLGAVLAYGVFAPEMVARGVIETVDYRSIVKLTLWPGAALLVSAGIVSFALEWRAVARSLGSLGRRGLESPRASDVVDEAPAWWFPVGVVALSPVIVTLLHALFGVPWWAAGLAVPLSLVMGIIAARVTGETDVTPTKALGPVTQLFYGAAVPGHLAANIMGANVTGGVGLHAADLLTDLKTGHILGASPRKQVIAQMFGVVVGAAAVVPAFQLLVPSADVLGSERFPAPAALVWASVSQVLTGGAGGLPPAARESMVWAGVVGACLAVLEKRGPAHLRPFVPSPSGLGIAMIMPASNAIAMFTGAMLAAAFRRASPTTAAKLVVPVASGFVAGESLTGITIALARAAGWMP